MQGIHYRQLWKGVKALESIGESWVWTK